MGNKRKLCSLALVSTFMILLLIIVSSIASATAEQSAQLKIIETRITTSESAIHSAVYGERIVWEDYRNEDSTSIYMYNLSTHKESQITNNESNQYYPAIYDDKIVYEDDRNGNWDIYMYDLSTSKETQITTNTSDQYYPAIYGNRIVWQDWRNDNGSQTNSDIYMYDLSTKKETQITTNTADSCYPIIYGSRIVWMDDSKDEYFLRGDIYIYDLSTKKQTQITTSGAARYPKIYGNRIIWDDRQNISVYDLSTHNETIISVYGDMGSTAIYGDKIVWGEGCPPEAGDCQMYDLYMYNLSTFKKIQLTDNGSPKGKVSMFQNRITWTDYRNFVNNPYQDPYSNPDIYLITLDSISPVAAFSAHPTSGKAPLIVKFTDKSTGKPTKWKWDFGDGTTSTKQNPTHKYSKVGSYTVRLTVINAKSSNTAIKTDYIKVVTKPVANFSAKPTSGKVPLTVDFTDQSTGIATKWKWNFGDGTISREKNPKHQYLQEGNYKITLTVSNAAGSNTVTKTNFIKVTTNTKPGIYSESK